MQWSRRTFLRHAGGMGALATALATADPKQGLAGGGPDGPAFEAFRQELFLGLTDKDLWWQTVPLVDGATVEVCWPVGREGYSLPITANEMMAWAAWFGVFPLTRAVFDQAHNAGEYVPRFSMPLNRLRDFVYYSEYLLNTSYGLGSWNPAVTGAHKLWVLSARGRSVNYGFHIPRAQYAGGTPGRYLDRRYTVIQSLGAAHNGNYWDYSQLLQFMRNLQVDGKEVDLRQALLDGHPAVWDEHPARLREDQLPF